MTMPQYQRQGYGRFLIDFSKFFFFKVVVKMVPLKNMGINVKFFTGFTLQNLFGLIQYVYKI